MAKIKTCRICGGSLKLIADGKYECAGCLNTFRVEMDADTRKLTLTRVAPSTVETAKKDIVGDSIGNLINYVIKCERIYDQSVRQPREQDPLQAEIAEKFNQIHQGLLAIQLRLKGLC